MLQSTVKNAESFRLEVRGFVDRYVLPIAQKIDEKQEIEPVLFKMLGEQGYLGANIPKQYEGKELNNEELGILHEEFGKSHVSVENSLTVIGMAVAAILRGSKLLKQTWLPKIAKGEVIPAFLLTEPNIGSDIQNIETSFHPCDEGYIINGRKKWITLGCCADIFIIFARNNNQGAVLIVEKNKKGIEIRPIQNMLGFRGNMLADIYLNNCFVPKQQLIGSINTGMNMIAPLALNEGRYMTAWGAVGLAQVAMDKALDYTQRRKQFGSLLSQLDSIKQTIAKMLVSIEASRSLCRHAGILREQGNPEAIKMTLMAKYHASKTASRVTEKTVQLLGAYGCHREALVERYFRDAKIMELIEGASEVLEIQIADLF